MFISPKSLGKSRPTFTIPKRLPIYQALHTHCWMLTHPSHPHLEPSPC
ncbi:hypothetical protein Nmel_013163 [Mimus melanotis]